MQNLILEWNELALNAIRTTKPGPPIAARAIGILYTGIFDAWAAYDAVANPVHSTVNRRPAPQRTDENREKAISQVAYRLLKDLFPSEEAKFAAFLTAKGMNPSEASVNANLPVGVGNKAANDAIAFYHNDNSNQAGNFQDTTGYVPKNNGMPVAVPTLGFDEISDVGKWQPLSYYDPKTELTATPSFIAPHWGQVKPFALNDVNDFLPPPPQRTSSQGFLDQAKHVIETQANLTDTQKVIAEYWADGPQSELPPGHWTIFATFVAKRDNLNLADSVKLFFVVANAIADAAISTWHAKVVFDYVRPVTAIRYLFRGKKILGWGGPGKGTVEMLGENWRPFQSNTFPTPPFAEYTSGHSGFSMAAAVALKLFTGSDRFGYMHTQSTRLNADPTLDVIGTSLIWRTFTEAAFEAGESRLYGGIHFYEGNVAGLEMGRQVGEAVFNKAQKHWDGI